MTRTSIDLVGDAGAIPNVQTVAAGIANLKAFATADQMARHYTVRKVTMPSHSTFWIAPWAGDLYGIAPTYARDWLGDPASTELAALAGLGSRPNLELYLWLHDNPNDNSFDGAKLWFNINLQAAAQMQASGLPDRFTSGANKGNLQGFCCGGIKAQQIDDFEHRGKVRNGRSVSATGFGSVFGVQVLGGEGGDCYSAFATDDGSIGSEAIVFQGRAKTARPWTLHSLRSDRMWRGFGCYGGGDGHVVDAVVTNCTGPADAKAPGGKISGNAANIETGPKGTGLITIDSLKTTNCDRFLVVNGNLTDSPDAGAKVASVHIRAGTSSGDTTGVLLSESPSPSVLIENVLFDDPQSAIVQATAAQAANVDIVGCTYRFPSGSRAQLVAGGVKAHGDWNLSPVVTGPAIVGIIPNELFRGDDRRVQIVGSNFAAGCTVKISGAGLTVSNVVRRDATQVFARVKVGRQARLGARIVTVTNPNGRSATVQLTI